MFIFVGGIPSSAAFVCVCIMNSMLSCVAVLALCVLRFRPFMPKCIHFLEEYLCVSPSSPPCVVSFISLLSFLHIGLYFLHFHKWLQFSCSLPQDLQFARNFRALVYFPSSPKLLCSMFLFRMLDCRLFVCMVFQFSGVPAIFLHRGSWCSSSAIVISFTVSISSIPVVFCLICF